MVATSATTMVPLELVLPFCTNAELARVSLLDREHARVSDLEWRQRVLARFGTLRFRTHSWRKCFKLRAHLARKVVDSVSARVYLMNGRGETHFFPITSAKSLMCSRERAVVYNRCERMFDLSLRINRSIQEISALIGMVSVDEARGLLNEHINLMASVASLRGSLLFESELFQVFPAPVLLDANALLRGTFTFPRSAETAALSDLRFVDSSTLMMQVWASIDGLIYRPLAPPTVLEPPDSAATSDASDPSSLALTAIDEPTLHGPPPAPAASTASASYSAVKLHDLSGMTIHIDDNTLRYRLLADEICVNALVSNSYLLYLFNPLQFRPLDWTFHAVVHVNDARYELPVQREGVFLNTSSYALRVFLSYGKITESDNTRTSDHRAGGAGATLGSAPSSASTSSSNRARGGEHSVPLDIPFADGEQVVFFHLTATNRISKEVREVAAKTSCLAARDSSAAAAVVPIAPATVVQSHQDDVTARAVGANEDGGGDSSDDDARSDEPAKSSAAATTDVAATSTERHVHLPFDAMICYSFAPAGSLQYVEFAIGFEPLMHRLGIADFLHEPSTSPQSPALATAVAGSAVATAMQA